MTVAKQRRAVYTRAGVATAALLIAATVIPMPFMVMSSGPTFDVLGKNDGTPIIEISGTRTFPTTGKLSLTTVSERGGSSSGVTVGEALLGWALPSKQVVPREVYYPEDVTGDVVEAEQQAAWSSSQSNAVGAALHHLKRPVFERPAVTLVVDGGPSDGVLAPGDFILSVDGKAVSKPEEVSALVRAKPVGAKLSLGIDALKDDGETRTKKTVAVTSGEDPHTPGRPWIGIGLDTFYQAPFDLRFTLKDVGGPSAGLFFALGIVDKLTAHDLAGRTSIAGTGTIDPDGVVGPIGGIDHKMRGARAAGAEFFLAPAENCGEVVGHIPDGLTVAKVASLDQAISAIDAFTSGSKDFPTCSKEN